MKLLLASVFLLFAVIFIPTRNKQYVSADNQTQLSVMFDEDGQPKRIL